MSASKFTDEFKRDAVTRVEERCYPVREVAERLGVSTKSIYTWQKQLSRPAKVVLVSRRFIRSATFRLQAQATLMEGTVLSVSAQLIRTKLF